MYIYIGETFLSQPNENDSNQNYSEMHLKKCFCFTKQNRMKFGLHPKQLKQWREFHQNHSNLVFNKK